MNTLTMIRLATACAVLCGTTLGHAAEHIHTLAAKAKHPAGRVADVAFHHPPEKAADMRCGVAHERVEFSCPVKAGRLPV